MSIFDHSKCVEDVMQAGITVYSGKETFEALGVAENRHANVVGDKDRFAVGDTFEVFSFALFHDVPNLGFIVHADGESLLFITDTMMVKQRFGLAFDIIAICCSYDVAVLREREAAGTIDPSLAKRLLLSHLEKQVALDYIDKFCNLSKCTEIHLLHMSKSNIDAEKTRQEFESKFFVKVYVAGT